MPPPSTQWFLPHPPLVMLGALPRLLLVMLGALPRLLAPSHSMITSVSSTPWSLSVSCSPPAKSDHSVVPGRVSQPHQPHPSTWGLQVTLPHAGPGLPVLLLLAEHRQTVRVLTMVSVLLLLLLRLKQRVMVASPAVAAGCSRGSQPYVHAAARVGVGVLVQV